MTKHIEMRLTMVGDRGVLTSLGQLAMEQGVLKSMQVVERNSATPAPAETVAKTVKPTKKYRSRPFNPGARVKALWSTKLYGITRGERGQVVTSVKAMNGYRITVKWDDGRTSDVASTVLATV